MNRRKKRRLWVLTVIWAVAMAVAILGQPRMSGEQFVLDGAIALFVTLAIDFLYRRVVPTYRRWPLVAAAPITAMLYFGAVIASIVAGIFLLVFAVTLSAHKAIEQVFGFFADPGAIVGVSYAFATVVGISFVLELSRRIGPGRIANWLIGRYRAPREETRLFLFIDLTDSTPLAEQLGALKFSYLLRDFFDDLTDPVLETAGQIVSYVGDEAIIVWKLADGYEEAKPIRCFQLFRDSIRKRTRYYMKGYGFVPQFKGAVHAGPVVVTEVGQIRTEVVYHGDALNTTARILGECSTHGAELLVSESTCQNLPELTGVSFEQVGRVPLKGKGEPVGIVRARFAGAIEGTKGRRRETSHKPRRSEQCGIAE